MVVCRKPLDYRVAPSSKNVSPQPRLDPLISCIATPWPYPTHTCWPRRRTSTVAAPRATPPTVCMRTGRPMFLFALYIPYFAIFHPIFVFLNGFGMNKTKEQNGFIGISTASFCYLTNETRLFFNSALHFFVRFFLLVWTGPYYLLQDSG